MPGGVGVAAGVSRRPAIDADGDRDPNAGRDANPDTCPRHRHPDAQPHGDGQRDPRAVKGGVILGHGAERKCTTGTLVFSIDVTLWRSCIPGQHEEGEPDVDGGVLIICQNAEMRHRWNYLGIEHIPFMRTTTHSEHGEIQTVSRTRLVDGPWRVRSDALAWMAVARGLHEQNSHMAIKDIGDLLRAETSADQPAWVNNKILLWAEGYMAQRRHDIWGTNSIKGLEAPPRTVALPSVLCKLFALEILSCPFLKNVLCRSVRAIR